MESENSLSCS